MPKTAVPKMGCSAVCPDMDNNMSGRWEANESAKQCLSDSLAKP